MSSHPGSRLTDAVDLALYMKKIGLNPEQVQDFCPTPGTASTVMYYTGIDPLSGKKVYCTTDYREKQLQRALLQYYKRENAPLIREALKKCGREDLIGYSEDCLVRPERGAAPKKNGGEAKEKSTSRRVTNNEKRNKGWAVASDKNRNKRKTGAQRNKGIPEHRIINDSDLKKPHKNSRNKKNRR